MVLQFGLHSSRLSPTDMSCWSPHTISSSTDGRSGIFFAGVGGDIRCLLERTALLPFTPYGQVFRLCSRLKAKDEGKVLEKLVSFWRRKLEGSPPRLALPMDRLLDLRGTTGELDIRSCWEES